MYIYTYIDKYVIYDILVFWILLELVFDIFGSAKHGEHDMQDTRPLHLLISSLVQRDVRWGTFGPT